jgi:glutamate racemase
LIEAGGAGRPRAPIGVFDSGVGGLTVLRALVEALPARDFVYLGDTARLPYGTKSPETVVRYALNAAETLADCGIDCLVVACNTASAVALPALRERFEEFPVIGVLEPGADAACAATRTGHIAVIATESTVQGGAYTRAILQRHPESRVTAQACQLFVALAEEGWHEGAVAQAAAARYLEPIFASGAQSCGAERRSAPDTLVLGCTHFPMLESAIREAVGPHVTIIDSAHPTAQVVRATLGEQGRGSAAGTLRFLATDGVERFARVGGRFLGREIRADEVELIAL